MPDVISPCSMASPASLQPGHYQIVCGEQRWRTARGAGLERVLVRFTPGLDISSDCKNSATRTACPPILTPVEDARAVLVAKVSSTTPSGLSICYTKPRSASSPSCCQRLKRGPETAVEKGANRFFGGDLRNQGAGRR